MFLPLSLSATVSPSGDPTLAPGLDPASVTPGTLGFLATLFMVVLVIFLIRDMVKRIRRVRYAAEVEEARALRAGSGDVEPSEAAEDGGRTPTGDPSGVQRPGGTHGPDNR